MEENGRYQFLYNLDLFDKTPELYFQRKPKKSTELGITLTIIYIILYFAFLIYKLVRMVKRLDVTFYDTNAYKDFPYINITNEEFYGAFMLGTGIDETIYYPRGQFVYNVKTPTGFVVERVDELEVEVCDINRFGTRYREMFKNAPLDKLYCMKKIEGILEGYANLDRYSYISVQFYPCINKTRDGRDCKPKEFLELYLATNIIEFRMQDNLLSPEMYDNPVQALEKDINTPVFLSLYQYIYSYIQIVILETDDGITGLNFWSKSKVERYPKYDESYIITAPANGNVLESGGALCEVTLQLAAKVLTTKRKYVTLIDVLGDVGGLMEILYTFFNLIASFFTEISYDKSLVNNLFFFDIGKKEIIINKKNKRNIKIKEREMTGLFPIGNNLVQENKSEIVDKSKNNAKEKLGYEIGNIIKVTSNSDIKNNLKRHSTKSYDKMDSLLRLNENKGISGTNRQIMNENSNQFNNLKKNNDYFYKRVANNERKSIFKDIKMNICCYCFLSKKRSIDVNLLVEGMKLITEKLDVMNIFIRLFLDEKIQEKLKNDFEGIRMSNKCIYNIGIIRKKKENNNDNG